MVRKLRGEVSLQVEEQTFQLVYDVNALCAIEDVLDKSVLEVMTTIKGMPKLGLVRALLWGGLRRYHEDLSLSDAGDLVMAAGMGPALKVVQEGIQAAFPQPTGDAKGKGDPQQTPAVDGTGANSSEPGTN